MPTRSNPGRTFAVIHVVALLLLVGPGVGVAQTPLPAPADRSVFDAAKVISSSGVSALEALHQELFAKTGVAIAVLTVPQLVDETIEDLAVRFGHDRGLGRKGEDRGVVVALSLDPRKIFVATGYGVEGFLPDGRVGTMVRTHAVPSLAAGDYSQGLLLLSAELARAAAQEFNVVLEGATPTAIRGDASRRGGRPPLLVIILGGLVFLYVAIRHPGLLLLLLMSGGRGGGGGGGFGGGGGGSDF